MNRRSWLRSLPSFAFVAWSGPKAATVMAHGAAAAHPFRPTSWTKVTFTTENILALNDENHGDVTIGGAGSQYPRSLTYDGEDGDFVLAGIDCGGVWRSLDGGETWRLASVGFRPNGAVSVAIDPMNKNRCVAAGAAGRPRPWHGVYLSTDQAASWSHRLATTYGGRDDYRHIQFAYDRSSFNGDHCTRLYWSQIKQDMAAHGTPMPAAASRFWRSLDGGSTWTSANESNLFSGGNIATYPTAAKKRLYVTTRGENDVVGGLYVSTDDGVTFTQVRSQGAFGGELFGLCTSPAEPDSLWVCTAEKIFKSTDEGATWTEILTPRMPSTRNHRLEHLVVSPIDANRILVRGWRTWHDAELWGTENGGASWWRTDGRQATGPYRFDRTALFFEATRRAHMFAWHPTIDGTVVSFASGLFYRSRDGGKIWYVFSNGYDGTIAGNGGLTFNPHRPDELFFALIDKGGAYSLDGGRIWTSVKATLTRGSSGRFAHDHESSLFLRRPDHTPVLACVTRASRHLKVSTDLGASWSLPLGWATVDNAVRRAFVHSGNEAVAFVCNYRTADYGATWHPLHGCDGVLCGDATVLFGIHHRSNTDWDIVRSFDEGLEWAKVITVTDNINERSLAYDPVRGFLFFVAGRRLQRLNLATEWVTTLDTPHEYREDRTFRGRWVRQVAVDPVDPAWVYMTRGRTAVNAAPAVCRSKDSGNSWDAITILDALPHAEASDGGQAAGLLNVHPATRELWVSTRCAGLWKWRPPELQ